MADGDHIPAVRALTEYSMTSHNLLTLRGIDGQFCTLHRQLTDAFGPGEKLVIIRESDFIEITEPAQRA